MLASHLHSDTAAQEEYQEKPVHAGPGQGEKRGWRNNEESRQVPVLSWSQSQTQY